MYRVDGDPALASTTAPGPSPKLNDQQLQRLRGITLGKYPRQLNFGASLWTHPIIEDVIEEFFKIRLHKSTVARLLQKLGLTPQEPIRRAFARDP